MATRKRFLYTLNCPGFYFSSPMEFVKIGFNPVEIWADEPAGRDRERIRLTEAGVEASYTFSLIWSEFRWALKWSGLMCMMVVWWGPRWMLSSLNVHNLLPTRYSMHGENYPIMIKLACALIVFRRILQVNAN